MRDLERPGRASARSRRVMVSTSNPVATAEALAVLQSGGNAVDAAVCAMAVLGVVEALNVGIGGDCFALVAPGGGPDVVAYNGSGRGDHGKARRNGPSSRHDMAPCAFDRPYQSYAEGGIPAMAEIVSNIRTLALAGALGALALVTGAAADAQDPEYAVANLHDENGNVVGTVGFGQTPDAGLWVTASFPAQNQLHGQRAIHLHERGACEPDFSAAGDHFNPSDREHGALAEHGMHAGDFPNLHFPETRPHVVEFAAPHLSLREGDPGNILGGEGTAVILHAGLDNYATQPTGNAGDRVACGVVEARE